MTGLADNFPFTGNGFPAYVGTVAPQNPLIGQIWFNPNNGVTQIWTAVGWQTQNTSVNAQTVNLNVPGGSGIGQAYLYWAVVPGNSITGSVIFATYGYPIKTYVLTNFANPTSDAAWSVMTGVNGSFIYTGTTAPAASLGDDADLYINTVSGGLYIKAATTWVLTGSIIGPAGAQGATGAAGAAGATGATGAAGAGIIAGGTTGQALVKTSGADYATQWATVSATPGGADTQVRFNDGGAFAGSAGLTFNKTSRTLTMSGATITTDNPVLNAAQTWNASGVTFTGLKFNAAGTSDANSASGSLLMDLQVGGASKVKIGKGGTVTFTVSAKETAIIPGDRNVQFSFDGLPVFGGGLTYFGVTTAASIRWSTSSVDPTATADLFLTRRAAASLRLGAADAATAVAQTLGVQGITGTDASAAAFPFTIAGSQGTGMGAGGSIVFQVAPAGSSGSAQNTLVPALTIDIAKTVQIAGAGSYNIAAVGVNNSNQYGIYYDSFTTGVGFVIGGGHTFSVIAGAVINRSDAYFGWESSGSGNFNTTYDTRLYRDATGTLAQRNGTAAQRFNLYGTYTSGTSYERLFAEYNSAGTAFRIGTEKGSVGGTARALEFQTDGVTRLTISTAGVATFTGLVNLGSNGILQTRYINNGNNTVSMFDFVADATGTATFAVAGSAPFLRFGGTSPSYPAIKRSSTTLQARLADDTAFAPMQGKITTDTAYTAGDPATTGYLTVYDSTGTAYKIPAVAA